MKELKEFLHVIKENDFVQGHEVLEDVWRVWKNDASKREESFILKGLINGSTAIALKVMKRDKPAQKVWKTFLKYESLIETVNSINTKAYVEAKALLFAKYEEFF